MKAFEFSIRASLKRSWAIFTEHIAYFLVLGGVTVVISYFSKLNDGALLSLAALILSIMWSYVGLSSALAAVDGKTQLLNFDSLKLHLPTVKQFFLMLGLSIAMALFVGAGFVLLIIPGIYFMVRLMFSNFAFVDRKEGIIPSMKYSWHLVKGDVFWTSLLALMVAGAMMFVGILLLGLGVIVAYPLALLFLCILYRDLTVHHAATSAIVEQPKEISPKPVSAETV